MLLLSLSLSLLLQDAYHLLCRSVVVLIAALLRSPFLFLFRWHPVRFPTFGAFPNGGGACLIFRPLASSWLSWNMAASLPHSTGAVNTQRTCSDLFCFKIPNVCIPYLYRVYYTRKRIMEVMKSRTSRVDHLHATHSHIGIPTQRLEITTLFLPFTSAHGVLYKLGGLIPPHPTQLGE